MPKRQITLTSALEQYEQYQRSIDRADQTIANMRSTMKPMAQMFGHKKLHQITRQEVTDYFLYMKDVRRRTPNSMRTAHATVDTFFRWAVAEGFVDTYDNPMNGRVKMRHKDPEGQVRVPVHRFPELLAIAESHNPRDRALCATGLYTLLRDQEMMALRIRDVDLQHGYIRANITKSRKFELTPIPKFLNKELRRWYEVYQDGVGKLEPEYFLFPQLARLKARDPQTGQMLPGRFECYNPHKGRDKAHRIVKPVLEEMGYATRDENTGVSLGLGAHTLRRSGARAYYDHWVAAGRPDAIRIVQTMLNHKNVGMTQLYIGLDLDKQNRDTLVRDMTIFDFEELSTIGLGAVANG